MALSSRRRRQPSGGIEAWPGYVDALSTLLMVIIFVLLVFVLAQGFLSFALNGRNKELQNVNIKLADVGRMLSLEQSKSAQLQDSLATLTSQLATSKQNNVSLSAQINALNTQLNTALGQAAASGNKATQLTAELNDAKQQLASMKQAQDALNKTVTVDKATIQEKLSDIAKMAEETKALAALRDQLETQAENAAARAMTEADRRKAVELELSKEKTLGQSAAAQIALLNQQVDQLKAQLASVAQALDVSEKSGKSKDVQIANLGQRLNAALAEKVQELQSYRSNFFGTLRKVLTGVPGIHVVGDRFVMQSDVLFPVGSADLSPEGVVEISKLAQTVQQIAGKIPSNIDWILDVDGYADKQPISGGGQYTSNWALSAARAISVVQLLIKEGVPQDHLAATGFGSNHPLAEGDTTSDYAKNRRIELRLTDYSRTRGAGG
jgi:chemotaxis protein MotB